MYKKVIVLSVFYLINSFFYLGYSNDLNSKIIPVPDKQIFLDGFFIINSNTSINYPDQFKNSINFFRAFLNQGKNKFLVLKDSNTTSNFVQFLLDEKLSNDEGYKIEIRQNGITITSKDNKGAFYAIQTLRQLIPASFEDKTYPNKEIRIKCQIIEDSPRFKYRGMHLDVGRHLFSVEFIKKYIDALAMLKFNTFHWHLTEDQGWRIEIKKYPKLNTIAAYRDSTLAGHYTDRPRKYDKTKYGGYYTQEQVKDIVNYALEREITIIPEIEMPGHSKAAIAAYPNLSCEEKPVNVATLWGVFEDIYCSKEETFKFLEDVIDEVVDLFPGKYIHIGGDEAPKTRWEKCNNCQSVIKREGLKDEHELQNYFISRMEKYINSKGKKIIGWDEILEGGLAPNATVMSWRGISGGIKAANMKHDVIMTPNATCYLDHYQSKDKNEPLAIGGYTPLEEIYNYEPIPEELDSESSKYIIGAQGNVWTEYMSTSEYVEYMVFPRIFALSEVVWSKNKSNFEEFSNRVTSFFDRLDKLNINYSTHLEKID
ncbi:MAG: beta-N-acetylhexosaminidase [Flavobacteriaceae bacterium]|jgi:hexosaminidase|nr:beta-N-acetylhexosaminidase [Flavobacteriaceae bacterium]MBT4112431.1 beta-N-acetylhexosaminidase [Flavobacteriaceae bacterium]MBT4614285.1 beta-N-acetylhexosaminidase [Flavobacteriaceae bacterium]MBT5246738.1 beta-N-acetylhexosaminidase [Flavobacteriaceae bacterium]MBT5649923.1 beta-N-acetylhexosaminidase [Flavobacteriaceae bacterium]